MSLDARSYSRQLVHPVTIISVSTGTTENIATMAWVSPVSFDPALLMVGISPKRFSHDLVLEAREFALLVLSDTQKELSTLAGTRSGRKENKWELEAFRKIRKQPKIIASPLLAGCRAVYECKLQDHFPAGDHTLFVGEIVRAEIDWEKQPLLLFNRNYHKLGDFIAKYP